MPTIAPASPAQEEVTDRPTASYETIEFIKKGQVTIPKRVRESLRIEPGQKGTLIELGGALLILPRRSETPALFDEVRQGLGTAEMSLEEMVLEMRRIRESNDYEGEA